MKHNKSDSAETAVPSGYHLIFPPGWVHIPLQSGTQEALDRLVFSKLKELPPEVPKDKGMEYRLRVRREIQERVDSARQANGLDLYFPVELDGLRYGIPQVASILVSEFTASAQDPGPEVILSRLASADADDAVTETMELADTLAVRRAYTRPAAPDRGIPVPGRSVEYALAVPNADRRYLVVSFGSAGDGDPGSDFSDAIAELFDAVVGTFRWTWEADMTSMNTAGRKETGQA